MKYLNKSDLLRYIKCPTAAYYGWKGYTNKNTDDVFLKFLSEEGESVGKAAHRLFSNGTLVDKASTKQAADSTTKLLHCQSNTVFEGCVISDCFLARPDVLVRKGNRLYLIEVKSKLGNLSHHKAGRLLFNIHGDIRAAWREYVYDLAFQCSVLRSAYPDFNIVPWLLLPEANSSASGIDQLEAELTSPDDNNSVRERREKAVLKFFNAAKAVQHVQEEVSQKMAEMKTLWQSGERPVTPVKYACRNCEYRLGNGRVKGDGFHECWGELATPNPHLFDLNQLYSLKQHDNKKLLLADEKIKEGKTSLYDVSVNELHGEHASRQEIQLKYQKSGKEWIAPELTQEIKQLQWPIAFLDFETTMAAIPKQSGIHPYQTLPCQFSAHILDKQGSCCHAEWLNTKNRIPTLAFIRALMNALENAGSILVYTDYENRILKESLEHLSQYGEEAAEERTWIYNLLNSGRIVDQHEWVQKYYFHPLMGGKTSIKKVLPAIWKSSPKLQQHPFFSRYYREVDQVVLNPYDTLPSSIIAGREISVREGCGAMNIYREMIHGAGANCDITAFRLGELLRKYCELDTVSQWITFEHWRQKLGL